VQSSTLSIPVFGRHAPLWDLDPKAGLETI
jgi:hypothetical protein